MTFAYPKLLYLLILIPVILVLWIINRMARRRKLKRFGDAANYSDLMPAVSKYMPAVKITVELLALAMLIIAAARPRAGEKEETVPLTYRGQCLPHRLTMPAEYRALTEPSSYLTV